MAGGFPRTNRILYSAVLWLPRRDVSSGALAGASVISRSDGPERLKAVGVRARGDRWHACRDK